MGERTILLDSTASTKYLNSDFLVEAVESGMGYVLVSSGRILPILPVFLFDENGPVALSSSPCEAGGNDFIHFKNIAVQFVRSSQT
jgi:hypothetical protein